MIFASADFFQTQHFRKISFSNTTSVKQIRIKIRPNILSDLIWIQTVCKCYQQTALTHTVKENVLNSTTPGRRQSKTISTIDECGSKSIETVFSDSHLSQVWRQMAIENTVSIDFWSTFLDSIGVFDCRLPGVSTIPVIQQEFLI